MPDWEHDEDRIEAASQAVLRIPGVHGVYLGSRYRNGRQSGEMALCVLVRTKKPLEEVAPRDRVPPEVAGIPTDVIESDPPRALQRLDSEDDKYTQPSERDLPTFDDEEYTRLRGGIACEGGGSSGTLGCIARASDTVNNGKVVLLSNWHILTSKGSGEGKTVRQPRESCFCCGRKVGVVLRTRKTNTGAYYLRHPATPNLDAGIALLNPGVEALAEMQQGAGSAGGTDLVRGVRADASITDHLAVQKRGSRTGLTQGTIESRVFAHAPEGNSDKATAFRRHFVIDPGFPPGTTAGVFRFAAGGDSGSVVMTQTGGEVVGLLWAVFVQRPLAPNRDVVVVKGVVSNIHEVISELQIEIATATTAGQILTNPATAPAPAPATLLSEGGAPQPVRATMLKQARFQIEQTHYGRQYTELIRRHHSEVSRLVRTNQRVGAIWTRYGGTAFVQAVLDAVALPDEPIPSMIASRPVAESTARIGMILKRYGSTALARDIEHYERAIPGLCGRTYNELLARLRAGESVLG